MNAVRTMITAATVMRSDDDSSTEQNREQHQVLSYWVDLLVCLNHYFLGFRKLMTSWQTVFNPLSWKIHRSNLLRTPVSPDPCWVQLGDDDLNTWELENTVVPPPVVSFDQWHVQVHTHLEGSIMVVQELTVVHLLVDLLSIFPPEDGGSVRVETCGKAADWRRGSLLQEKHRGKLWRRCTRTKRGQI